MNSACGSWLLRFCSAGILLLAVKFVGATTADVLPVRPITGTTSSVYTLTFQVNEVGLSTGVIGLRCRARVTPNLPAGETLNAQPAEVASTGGGVGRTAGCTVNIPISWPVGQLPSSVVVSYEIDAVSAAGTVQKSFRERGIAAPLPPAGGKAQLHFDLRF